MTQEKLTKAMQNRKERAAKLAQYEDINRIYANTADDDIIWLDKNSTCDSRIFPTVKEFRFLLRNIRDRLDAEISDLDKEFGEL